MKTMQRLTQATRCDLLGGDAGATVITKEGWIHSTLAERVMSCRRNPDPGCLRLIFELLVARLGLNTGRIRLTVHENRFCKLGIETGAQIAYDPKRGFSSPAKLTMHLDRAGRFVCEQLLEILIALVGPYGHLDLFVDGGALDHWEVSRRFK